MEQRSESSSRSARYSVPYPHDTASIHPFRASWPGAKLQHHLQLKASLFHVDGQHSSVSSLACLPAYIFFAPSSSSSSSSFSSYHPNTLLRFRSPSFSTLATPFVRQQAPGLSPPQRSRTLLETFSPSLLHSTLLHTNPLSFPHQHLV